MISIIDVLRLCIVQRTNASMLFSSLSQTSTSRTQVQVQIHIPLSLLKYLHAFDGSQWNVFTHLMHQDRYVVRQKGQSRLEFEAQIFDQPQFMRQKSLRMVGPTMRNPRPIFRDYM